MTNSKTSIEAYAQLTWQDDGGVPTVRVTDQGVPVFNMPLTNPVIADNGDIIESLDIRVAEAGQSSLEDGTEVLVIPLLIPIATQGHNIKNAMMLVTEFAAMSELMLKLATS